MKEIEGDEIGLSDASAKLGCLEAIASKRFNPIIDRAVISVPFDGVGSAEDRLSLEASPDRPELLSGSSVANTKQSKVNAKNTMARPLPVLCFQWDIGFSSLSLQSGVGRLCENDGYLNSPLTTKLHGEFCEA
jgi:hypothetical protein